MSGSKGLVSQAYGMELMKVPSSSVEGLDHRTSVKGTLADKPLEARNLYSKHMFGCSTFKLQGLSLSFQGPYS